MGPSGGQGVGRAARRAGDRAARLARQRRLVRPAGAAAVGATGGARPARPRPLGGAAAGVADLLARQHLHAALPAAQAGSRARLHRGPRRRRAVGPLVRRPLPGARRQARADRPAAAGAVRRARRPHRRTVGRRPRRACAEALCWRRPRAAAGRLQAAWPLRGGRPPPAAAVGAQGRQRRRLRRRHTDAWIEKAQFRQLFERTEVALAAKVTCPVLSVEADPAKATAEATRAIFAKTAASFAHCKVADGQHHAHLEQPEKVADVLNQFLQL